jgi:uncharacterized protein
MVTDLVQIRLLGEKKREENLRFRRFLKSHHHSDLNLRRIAESIEQEVACTACANCCRVGTVQLSERDVDRLSRYLRIPAKRVLTDFAMETEEEGFILKRTEETGCVFLDGKLCAVYDARPDICQRYPHLVRGNGSIASRMWAFVDRAPCCPIVYNSLEAFKVELQFR